MAMTPEMQSAEIDSVETADDHPAWESIKLALRPIASLKLTVALLGMAIFIVLAGTLAQVDADIWEVVNKYFRVNFGALLRDGFSLREFFVVIDTKIFFPPSFFPSGLPHWLGWLARIQFPFPKGWLIGAVMLLNLLAAHLVRFKVQAADARLVGGLAVIGVGCIVTALVILSGSSAGGFQTDYWISWNMLWGLLQVSLLTAGAAALYGALTLPREQKIARVGLGMLTLLALSVLAWTFLSGSETRLADAYMRILYQLVKATIAGLVLLAGCVMVFRKRAGIVVLHAGVGLMMISEVIVGLQAQEAQMRVEEGHARNFVEDIRTVELAFVQTLDDGRETHTVVPGWMLRDAAEQQTTISNDELPVDVQVVEYLQNSELVSPAELAGMEDPPRDGENPATAGIGLQRIAIPVRASTGTDTGGAVDSTSAYVRLIDKQSGADLGTWLVSIDLDWFSLGWNKQTIAVGDQDYSIALRFERAYKPYTITLNDIRKKDYIGTATPRDYSSFVRLQDEQTGTDRDDVHIWMNNPLRYSGETFYQSSYFPPNSVYRGSGEWTSLQVVKNRGWMIPYVACMIVVVGMCAHFLMVLWRFLDRRQREQSQAAARRQDRNHQEEQYDLPTLLATWALPAAVVLFAAMWIGGKTRVPSTPTSHMNLTAFGNLPVVYEGRAKPIDTLARNSLLIVSDRQDFTGRMDPQTWRENWDNITASLHEEYPQLSVDDLKPFRGGDQPLADLVDLVVEQTDADRQEAADFVYETTSRKQPAVRWLLDVITASRAAREHRVFKIENLDVLDTLGLSRRPGFRYAIEEIQEEKLHEFLNELHEAEELNAANPEKVTFYQRKVLDLGSKLTVFQRLSSAFVPPEIPLPSDELRDENFNQYMQMMKGAFDLGRERLDFLENSRLPLAIPYEQLEDQHEEELLGTAPEWIPYSAAYTRSILMANLGVSAPDAVVEFNHVLVSYAAGDVDDFNDAVADYATTIAADVPDDVSMHKIRFESFFNHAAPFYYAAWLYLFAFILTVCGWLGWSRPLNRAAFCLIAFTLLVHVLAIGGRIYISGRPPVTNLYSSAVFIGLGCAVLGIVMELLYKIGVGNIVAAVAGCVTLGIAHFLAGDGDTFTVLQAVLDTQFWLATHVVCITLGYATTFVAGAFGLAYLCARVPLHHILAQTLLWTIVGFLLLPPYMSLHFELDPLITRSIVTLLGLCVMGAALAGDYLFGLENLSPAVGKAIIRMLYGALCFSIFFSFFGTVLGGLWADDSWGRFWGWDPKENGALIIVLWNALVLHARWDGIVRNRGLAVLAVLGNIAVSWSWFGVNELGVGLHSYGFTEGVLLTLGLYCLSQLTFALTGFLPTSLQFHKRESAST